MLAKMAADEVVVPQTFHRKHQARLQIISHIRLIIVMSLFPQVYTRLWQQELPIKKWTRREPNGLCFSDHWTKSKSYYFSKNMTKEYYY